jgi:hypothetical protein
MRWHHRATDVQAADQRWAAVEPISRRRWTVLSVSEDSVDRWPVATLVIPEGPAEPSKSTGRDGDIRPATERDDYGQRGSHVRSSLAARTANGCSVAERLLAA